MVALFVLTPVLALVAIVFTAAAFVTAWTSP